MRKRNLFTIAIFAAVLAMTACSAKTTTSTEPTTVVAEPVTESESAEVTESEETADETISDTVVLSRGTYKAEHDFGEDKALFVSTEGNEFLAQISETTELPEGGLIDGDVYIIAHSEMMTMSLPGILPQVYSISADDGSVETDAAAEGAEVTDELVTENAEVTEETIEAIPLEPAASSEVVAE